MQFMARGQAIYQHATLQLLCKTAYGVIQITKTQGSMVLFLITLISGFLLCFHCYSFHMASCRQEGQLSQFKENRSVLSRKAYCNLAGFHISQEVLSLLSRYIYSSGFFIGSATILRARLRCWSGKQQIVSSSLPLWATELLI